MTYKCSVPHCRGNYDPENRARVFRFPVDEKLKKAWMQKISRKDFKPTKNSRVCERHFDASCWETHDEMVDEKQARTISVLLTKPRLKKVAIPTIFPSYPSYMNSNEASRISPNERKIKNDAKNLLQAIRQSLEFQKAYEVQRQKELKTVREVEELKAVKEVEEIKAVKEVEEIKAVIKVEELTEVSEVEECITEREVEECITEREVGENTDSYTNEESSEDVQDVDEMPWPSIELDPYTLAVPIPIQESSGAVQDLFVLPDTGIARDVKYAGIKKSTKATQCNFVRKQLQLPSMYQVKIKGRRIVDVDFLLKTLKEVNLHNESNECNLNDVYIVRENRAGLVSCFSLRCVTCKYRKELWTEDQEDGTKNINAEAVVGVLDISCSFDDMKELFKKLAIPPITRTLFSKEHKKVSKNYKATPEPEHVSSIAPETGTFRTHENVLSIVPEPFRVHEKIAEQIQIGGVLVDHEIEIKQENETEIDDPLEGILPRETEVVANEDRMVVDQEIPTKSVKPIVKIEIDSDAEGEKLVIEPEMESTNLAENMETSVDKIGCISQHQAKSEKTAEKFKTCAFSDGRGQSMPKFSLATTSSPTAPVFVSSVGGVFQTQANLSTVPPIPGPPTVIAGMNVFPNQMVPNLIPPVPGMSLVASGMHGVVPYPNAMTAVPGTPIVSNALGGVLLYPTQPSGIVAIAGSHMVLNQTESVPYINQSKPGCSKATHGKTSIQPYIKPNLKKTATSKVPVSKSGVKPHIIPSVPKTGSSDVNSNIHSKSGEASVATDMTSASNPGAARPSNQGILPIAQDHSRCLNRFNNGDKSSFFTLPGGAPKGFSEPTKPKQKTDEPNPEPKRPCFRCDDCDINFPKFESLDSHRKSYCIKRLKIPPSSTITSGMLANSTADSAQTQRIVKTDSVTPTCVEELQSAMSIKRSFLESSVKAALDAQYAINLHKTVQKQTQQAFKDLRGVLSREKNLNPYTSLEERQNVSEATSQALLRAEAAYMEEKYSAATVEQALHRQKTTIEATLSATVHEQTVLVATFRDLKVKGSRSNVSKHAASSSCLDTSEITKDSMEHESRYLSTPPTDMLKQVPFYDIHHQKVADVDNENFINGKQLSTVQQITHDNPCHVAENADLIADASLQQIHLPDTRSQFQEVSDASAAALQYSQNQGVVGLSTAALYANCDILQSPEKKQSPSDSLQVKEFMDFSSVNSEGNTVSDVEHRQNMTLSEDI